MEIKARRIGTTKGHVHQAPSLVESFSLDNGRGLSITVWSYGATLVEVLAADDNGRLENLVVRHKDLESYEHIKKRSYLGATVGRYARCISNGRIRLDGKDIVLNPNYGQHHLHGGPFGFDSFVWDARIVQTKKSVGIKLKLTRPSGDQGYPGEITAETSYTLTQDNVLIFEHRATTTVSTICDITNHSMWNLSGGDTIDQHFLCVNAEKVLLVDENLIPTGMPVPVTNSDFDFRLPRKLSNLRLDNCYMVRSESRQACLCDPSTDRSMTIYSNQPGMQIYTGDFFSRTRAGICLQTGSWPNAPVRSEFPSSRLDPGEIYFHQTIHNFDGPNFTC